jgi:hypothetical protein
MANNYFQQFQQVLVDTLSALTTLDGATFVAERQPTLVGKLLEKLQQKTGLVVLVRFPYPTVANTVALPPRFDTVAFKIRVIENILSNPTDLTAHTAAEIIYKALFGLDLSGSYNWILDIIQPRSTYPWSTQAGNTTQNIVEMTFQTTIALRS